MKQRVINITPDWGITTTEVSAWSDRFVLKFEDEKKVVKVHLETSDLEEIGWCIREVIKKRQELLARIVRSVQP